MYYELDMSQEDIARIKGVSRSTISRMLDSARREGIVQVRVSYPLESVEFLEADLMRRFQLQKAFISRVVVNDPRAILQDVCRAAAAYIVQTVRPGQRLGVSWGTTMYGVMTNLPTPVHRPAIPVLQLNGGVARSQFSTQAGAIVEGFAAALGGVPYLLPVPAIVDSPAIAQALTGESSIRMSLDLARGVDIAVFGIGYPSPESILLQAGYFDARELDYLLTAGAVGDICSRFFGPSGEICDPDLDSRTVGISLADLQQVPVSVAVATGGHKAAGILGGLRGRYFNVLFTDEMTARAVLNLDKTLPLNKE